MALSEQKKEFTDLLAGLVPADKAQKVVAATEALVDQVREQVNEELAEQYGEIKDQVDRLVEQRDEAIQRAQEAELKLQKIAEDSSEIVEQAKQAVREEMQGQINVLTTKLAKADEEKDALQERIAERYEELRVSDREKLIDKLDEYVDGEISKLEERLVESRGTNNPRLAQAMTEIADIVARYQLAESGDQVASAIVEEHQQEVARLTAQVRQLEARNVRLSTENEMLREQNDSKPEPAAKTVTESAAPAPEPPKPAPAQAEAQKDTKSRASELLREAFASEGAPSGSTAGEQEDGWLTDEPARTREDRLAKAEGVVGKGIVIDEADILKETTDKPAPNKSEQRLDERVTPGTDNLTLQEGRVLSGIV